MRNPFSSPQKKQRKLDEKLCHLISVQGALTDMLALMDEGANPNAIRDNGQSVLYLAVWHRQSALTEALLQRGADPHFSLPNGHTLLMESARDGTVAIAEHLLNRGVDILARDDDGETALSKAAAHGNQDMTDFLILRGADPTCRDEMGWTILMEAVNNNHPDLAAHLLQHYPIIIDAQNNEGYTALHIAADNGNWEIIELLLKHGASVNIKDNHNRTAADIADEAAFEGIGRFVRQHASPPPPPSPWKLEETGELTHRSALHKSGYSITEIFNFEARHYTRIAQHMETKAESQSFRLFDEIADKYLLEEAFDHFIDLGGIAQKDVVHRRALQKPKPRFLAVNGEPSA